MGGDDAADVNDDEDEVNPPLSDTAAANDDDLASKVTGIRSAVLGTGIANDLEAETKVLPSLDQGNPLGLGGATIDDGKGRNHGGWARAREFNMGEFLQLAHKVIDVGYEATVASLERLKMKWVNKFGRVRMIAPFLSIDDNPFARGLRRACRHLSMLTGMEQASAAPPQSQTLIATETALGFSVGATIGIPAPAKEFLMDGQPLTMKPATLMSSTGDLEEWVLGAPQMAALVVPLPVMAETTVAVAENVAVESSGVNCVGGAEAGVNQPPVVSWSGSSEPRAATLWKHTTIGYFLGKKPYFHHLSEFVPIWPAMKDVIATANGFYFFQFHTMVAMEEVIEGGI
ncbi:UNVERIFIED_CONTAM: hypothetical protein Sindi_2463700 [Sesamum indicum]